MQTAQGITLNIVRAFNYEGEPRSSGYRPHPTVEVGDACYELASPDGRYRLIVARAELDRWVS